MAEPSGRIGYGIIGFGGIAENRIAMEGFCADKNRFQDHPEAELIGVTDLNPVRRKAAEKLGLSWYDSPDELLEDPAISAVFIATNNASHGEMAEKALEAGKHCVVEKPIATTMEEAGKLQTLAKNSKLSLMVDHMMVHNVFNRKASDMISQGEIGDVNDICTHMEFLYGSTPEEAASWRCSKPEELGGPIGDVACHCFYMAEFLLQDTIASLSGVYLPQTMGIVVEEGAYIQYKMTSGISGSVRVSFNQSRGGLEGTLKNLGFEVYGTAGTLRSFGTLFQLSGHSDEPITQELILDHGEKSSHLDVDEVKNIYSEMVTHHVRSIQTNNPSTGEDGVHNLKLITRSHESAGKNGEWIGL